MAGACSGYLLQSGETQVLMDCGNGVLAQMRRWLEPDRLDALLLTHLHGDHIADLLPLAYALKYGDYGRESRLPLYGPPGLEEQLGWLARGCGAQQSVFQESFQLREYQLDGRVEVGELRFQLRAVPHLILTHAVDVQDTSGARLTFSADCGMNSALVELARETPLLLCEASMGEPDSGFHLSAEEAGSIAERAGAQALLLTHYPGELAPELCVRAASTYSGPISLARVGETHLLAGERPDAESLSNG